MPDEPAPGPAAEDGTLTERVDKLETGQESMSAKLDTILDRLTGPPASDEPVTRADEPAAADMAEQMKEAVRAVHAERDQAAAKEAPRPEVQPREAGQPAKQRMAAILFGKEAKR